MTKSPKKKCPLCGSTNIKTEHVTQALNVPLNNVSFMAVEDHCTQCGFVGDFLNVNLKSMRTAIDRAKKSSMKIALDFLAEKKNMTMAYLERIFEIPARTMMRWKYGNYSASSLALMRILATYPWIAEVAEEKFDPEVVVRLRLDETQKGIFDESRIMASPQIKIKSTNEVMAAPAEKVPLTGTNAEPTLVS